MAYIIDSDGDIVISGFQKGIGASPYSGLTDMKSVNPDSVPGEASVAFATQSETQAPTYTGITVAADGTGNILLTGLNSESFIEIGQSLTFGSSTISGATPATLFYVSGASRQSPTSEIISITLTYGGFSPIVLGTTGSATLSVTPLGVPKSFATMSSGEAGTNFMIDSNGRVWSDNVVTTGGTNITATSSWVYTGNTLGSGSTAATGYGNGLVYWRTANSTSVGDWDGWLFIFRNGFIDYSNVNGVNSGAAYNHVGTYTYGWSPETGTTGVTSAYLTGANLTACPHNAIVGPDGNLYFCDYFTTWKIQQLDIVTPISFSPTNNATYIATHAHNLPIQEIATCISPLGSDFVIGGRFNRAFVWNGVDQLTYSYAILLGESYVSNIVTVNTNAYIFCGNRGNIYQANGSQANIWQKVPDHISGTSEPYFVWGGATYNKGRIYFSFYVTNNARTNVSGYGGVWAVDTTTGAMWLSNQLSYGTYVGYASALSSVPTGFGGAGPLTVPVGYGLHIGWVSGASVNGIDKTISTPYTAGQSWVVSDMIPVGTLLKPMTASQIEFKTSMPLLANETVQLLQGSSLNDLYGTGSMTSLGTTTGDTTGTVFSGNFPIKVQGQQWLVVQAILTAKSSGSSLNRITELRVIGDTIVTKVQSQPYSLQ